MDTGVWRDVAYVQNSRNRERVLTELVDAGRPMTPTELADELGVVVKTASRAVRELADRGLAACQNPDAPRDRRYTPTEHGREVRSRLEDVADRDTAVQPVTVTESPPEYGEDRPDEVTEAASTVLMSENRTAVLLHLDHVGIPLTPSEIAEDLGLAFNSASRAVRQLHEQDLLQCVTPDVDRFRRYTVTDRGEAVAAVLTA
ncbi:MAG: winged helix-turn-helix transcriptional regulator [Candidatus Nanohaloarchaea archaeon]